MYPFLLSFDEACYPSFLFFKRVCYFFLLSFSLLTIICYPFLLFFDEGMYSNESLSSLFFESLYLFLYILVSFKTVYLCVFWRGFVFLPLIFWKDTRVCYPFLVSFEKIRGFVTPPSYLFIFEEGLCLFLLSFERFILVSFRRVCYSSFLFFYPLRGFVIPPSYLWGGFVSLPLIFWEVYPRIF